MQKSIFYLNSFEQKIRTNSKFSPNPTIYHFLIADNPAPQSGNQNSNPTGERGISIRRLRNTGSLKDKIELQRSLLLRHCQKTGESLLWEKLYMILINDETTPRGNFKSQREANYHRLGHLSAPALLNYLKSQI